MDAALASDLADLPPGPGLATALDAIALDAVPNDRMLDVLAAQYRQLCHEQARTAAVLAEVGRCSGYPEPGEVSRLAVPERYASEESRAALSCTRCRCCMRRGWPGRWTGPGSWCSTAISPVAPPSRSPRSARRRCRGRRG